MVMEVGGEGGVVRRAEGFEHGHIYIYMAVWLFGTYIYRYMGLSLAVRR